MKRFRERMIANALAARNRSGGGVVPITLPASLSGDPFVVKYSLTGVPQWAAALVGNGSSDTGSAVAVDSTGVYVIGAYGTGSIIDLGNGVTLPISVSTDAFIVKYSLAGVAQWATTIRGTGIETGGAIAVDSTGVYVTGRYSSTSAVDLGNGVTLPISVSFDAYIVKYSLAGVAQWATTINGPGAESGRGLTVDSTGVYVTGTYSSTSIVSLGNGVTLPISVGASAVQDGYIVKYSLAGVAQWATTIRGTGNDSVIAVAVDSTGVYVGGGYISTSAVDLGNGVTLPISTASGLDGYIAKYSLAGVAQWATTIRGEESSNENVNALSVDSTGVYITGTYSSTSIIDLGNGVTLPISVGLDVYIVKYSLTGVAQWAATMSGTVSDTGRGLTVDSTDVYVTGNYRSTSIVSLGNGVTLPISQGTGTDAFTVKYSLAGVAQWATRIGGTGNDDGRAIAVDPTGVYVTGQYTSTSAVIL